MFQNLQFLFQLFRKLRMGLCESCCPQNSDNSQQEEAYGDRSRLVGNSELGSSGLDSTEHDHDASYDEGRLINGSVPTGGDFLYGNSKGASVPKAPVDENQVTIKFLFLFFWRTHFLFFV